MLQKTGGFTPEPQHYLDVGGGRFTPVERAVVPIVVEDPGPI